MQIQTIPYILLLSFLWGTTIVASRVGVDQYSPTTYISLRLFIAGLGYAIIYLLSRRNWPSGTRLWKHSTMLGVFGTVVPMTTIVSSLQYLSSGIAAILITTSPALVVLLAHFTLPDERLNLRKVVGIILAMAGALSLALRGESGLPDVSQADPRGYIFMGIAMVAGSIMVIYARKFMCDLDSLDVASIRTWVSTLAVAPLSLFLVGFDLSQVNRQGVIALIYASIMGTFIAMLLEFYNIKRFGATASVMTSYAIPVFATIGGVLLLNETVTLGMLGGTVLIVIGVFLINQRTY